jgi:hypothetical protein
VAYDTNLAMTIAAGLKFDFYKFNWNLDSSNVATMIRESYKPQTQDMKVPLAQYAFEMGLLRFFVVLSQV